MDQVCTPLPDELARSHLIRLQRINSISTPSQALKQLAFGQQHECDRDPVPARRLAKAAAVCPEQYVQRHTFMPYWMLRPRETRARLNNSILLSLAVPAPVLSFCHECRTEDTRTFGFAYWRRKHQLAGASFCSEHHELLSRTRHGAPRTSSLPAEHRRQIAGSRLKLSSAQRDAVLRYQALGEGLLGRAAPISPNRTLLASWVRSRLGHEHLAPAAVHLQRHCFSVFGERWMQEGWGSTAKRNCPTGVLNRLRSAVAPSGESSTEVITLVATAVTNSAAEALRQLEMLDEASASVAPMVPRPERAGSGSAFP